ncbi:hypothetical protein GCM10012280_27290 [Wenjunlia tyrosinilytica]|uniref:Uncharacterized protein n=1 Tax=Wenjunlia tyrosinilytica TaxID=1544741 RepID=A0A917ZQG5_9ACTN|nr:hypothetical protein GCM10012280_27290 [Wenjunlia tyrosinilytica]
MAGLEAEGALAPDAPSLPEDSSLLHPVSASSAHIEATARAAPALVRRAPGLRRVILASVSIMSSPLVARLLWPLRSKVSEVYESAQGRRSAGTEE